MMEKNYDNINKEMAGQAQSTEDMKQYGYTWEGMLPLPLEAALYLYENEDMQIFRLYEDGSESITESPEEIKDHAEKGGIFGVHKEDWNALSQKAVGNEYL